MEQAWPRPKTEIGRTSPVGCFLAGTSSYGALDMMDNVWEWCSSVGFRETKYPYQSDDGREELEREIWRAVRGASWYNERRYARCAYRYGTHPDGYFGFRVVRPGSPPEC